MKKITELLWPKLAVRSKGTLDAASTTVSTTAPTAASTMAPTAASTTTLSTALTAALTITLTLTLVLVLTLGLTWGLILPLLFPNAAYAKTVVSPAASSTVLPAVSSTVSASSSTASMASPMASAVSPTSAVSVASTAKSTSKTASPYDMLAAARTQTHSAGIFRLRGEETSHSVTTLSGKTTKTARYYHISGYNAGGTETYLQFESRIPDPKTGAFISGAWSVRHSFLLTTTQMYTKTSQPPTDWTPGDITAMLPKLISLGTLDQFFMLEMLNGDRLSLYAPYLSVGSDAKISGAEAKVGGADCTTIKADISRTQFAELSGALTKDIKALLGPAAEGLTEAQLALMQVFARGMLSNLDAEVHLTFFIEKDSGRIVQINAKMDMADPYGNRAIGAVSRIQSESSLTLYDFGKDTTRVIP